MTDLEALHAHTQEHHRIVTGILRGLAGEADVPYPVVRDLFRDGNQETTAVFWDRLWTSHPGRFVGIFWCHGCRRFGLHEKTH
jgi:hypothetical protein